MVFVRNRDWYDLGLSSRREVVGPIYKAGSFYQTFRSPKNDLLGINLYLSTYGKNVVSSYKLILLDGDCKNKVLETNITNDVDDNSYREVIFEKIKDSANKNYCFTLEPVGAIESPITLHYSKSDSYDLGVLILGEKVIEKEDVVFQLVYPLN